MTQGLQGWPRHRAAVDSLRQQVEQVPAGESVRLAKSTSNLFRQRTAASRPGLDVSGLDGVIAIEVTDDGAGATAQVQGMCTYEDLVSATLPHGFMPTVVPQLRTITLGGAVTGLGVESSSFRAGLPHEAVREMDILTGTGEILTCSRDQHADLFRAFPNSYGSLGYAVRLEIELAPIKPIVRLRHLRCHSVAELQERLADLTTSREFEGRPVDFLDGVVFSADESYLVVANWEDESLYASDYTGMDIYYRSIQQRSEDHLTAEDYIWRWDTDWFWCSRALFVQRPAVRRVVPKRFLRSDVYGKVIRFENSHGWWARYERSRGLPERERVVQDIEVPIERTAEFLEWFLREVPIEPIWVCPLALEETGSGDQPWTLYPLRPGTTYVNVGFWSTVPIEGGRADGDVNRLIEAKVAELDGHKSLYSDSYYDEETFHQMYGGEEYQQVKATYDPQGRFPDLFAKAVGNR